MPMIIPLVAIGVAAAIGTVTAWVVGTVVAVGLTMALSKKTAGVSSSSMYTSNIPGTSYQTNPQQLTFANDAPRRMVYGQSRISGVVAYANVNGSGYENLYLVIVVAAHKITEIGTMYFDGEKAEDVASGYYEVWYHDGSQVTADSKLMSLFPSDWDANCILKGCAYAVVKLVFNKSVYKNGRPNVQFDVRGKQVYDPRDGVTRWTNNAALCIADFLTDTDGLKATSDEIDWETVKASADISAQIPDGMTASLCDGRYTIDGVVELATRNGDTISSMLSACSGTVVWTEGRYKLYVGAGRLPVGRPITSDDLSGAPTVQPNAPAEQSFNCIKGTFMDSSNGWVMNDWPPVIGQEYVDQDGGERIFRDIVLQFTTSPLTAQRLGNIFLRRARMEGVVTLPCKWSCFNYEVWDVIELKLPEFGWISKQFQVTDWKMTPPNGKDPGGIELQLQEYNFDAFSDDMDLKPIEPGGVVTIPDVTVPKPVTVLYATSDTTTILADGTPQVRFDWPRSADVHCIGYEIAYGRVPFTPIDSDYEVLPSPAIVTKSVPTFSPGDTVMGFIRTINSFNKRSDAIASNPVTILGIPGQFPEDVRGFTVVDVDTEYVDLSWSAPAGKVRSTEIRFSSDNDFDHSVAVSLVSQPQNIVRLRKQTVDGWYFASFVSLTGEFSFTAAKAPGTKRDGAWDVMHNTLSKYKGTARNGVWRTPYRMVPESSQDAANLGWELFDQMVYLPITDVAYWSDERFKSTSNSTLDVSGNIGVIRAPGIPGALPIAPAQCLVTYLDGQQIVKEGTFITGEGAYCQIGFEYTVRDQQGVVFNAANLSLSIGDRGRVPFGLDVSRNTWGDVVFSWLAEGYDPSFEVYIVDIFHPGNGLDVIASIEVPAHQQDDNGRIYADWPCEDNVSVAVATMGGQFAWESLVWRVRIKSTPLETDIMATNVVIDDESIVKVLIVCGINSLIGGYFNDLSDTLDPGGTGKEGRKDVVAASTLRVTYAQFAGLRPVQVMPLMTVIGSSPINPMPYQAGFPLDNYWWNPTTKSPGPNLIIADGLVKKLKIAPSFFIESGPGESTGIAYAPVPQRPAILAAWRQSNIEMLAWMRSNWNNAALEIWFQGSTTSWWGAPPPTEVNYEGSKLLRDLQTNMARNVPGFKVASYVPESNRWETYRNEMADGIGWVHYSVEGYHAAAREVGESLAKNRNLAFDVPPWVDFQTPTNMRSYKRDNGDVVFEWDGRAGKSFVFKNLSVHPDEPGLIFDEVIGTAKIYVWPLADQKIKYPETGNDGASSVYWMVAEIDLVANDVGPFATYAGPVAVVDPSIPPVTNLKAKWQGAVGDSDVLFTWDASPIGGSFKYRSFNVAVFGEVLHSGATAGNSWLYTAAQMRIDYGFVAGFFQFEVQGYNASTGTVGETTQFTGSPT